MDGIIDTTDMSLSKLWDLVKDSEAWCVPFGLDGPRVLCQKPAKFKVVKVGNPKVQGKDTAKSGHILSL